MDQLWAPWRMELIGKGESPAADACIFCDLPAAPAAEGQRPAIDRGNLILGRTPRTFAILNKYPYNNGHLMVIPRRHGNDLGALEADEHLELAEMLRVALRLVQRAYGPHAANLGMNLGKPAGAGIAGHLHWHIVPRWTGDTNFMPITGSTAVLPEALAETAAKLRAALAEQQPS